MVLEALEEMQYMQVLQEFTLTIVEQLPLVVEAVVVVVMAAVDITLNHIHTTATIVSLVVVVDNTPVVDILRRAPAKTQVHILAAAIIQIMVYVVTDLLTAYMLAVTALAAIVELVLAQTLTIPLAVLVVTVEEVRVMMEVLLLVLLVLLVAQMLVLVETAAMAVLTEQVGKQETLVQTVTMGLVVQELLEVKQDFISLIMEMLPGLQMVQEMVE